MDTLPIDDEEDPQDRPDFRRCDWGRIKTTALLVILAEAVGADDVGRVVGATVELGRRVQAGMIAESGSGPSGKRVQP